MLAQNTSYREEAVRFAGAAGTLAGTLAVPEGRPRGSILIIGGSGPNDRDGRNKRFDFGAYREIGRALCEQGFVTLRYDKRGIGESQGDYYETGFWDLAADAQAAVDFLRAKLPDAGPTILLGHSEGCIIAPAVNAKAPVDGIILLAGTFESVVQTMARQSDTALAELAHMRGPLGLVVRALRVAEKQRRKSKAVMAKIMASQGSWIRVGGAKLNARWIREHAQHDVAQDLPGVRCPALAITGAKDIQVIPDHARQMAEAVSGPAEWHIIPDMTHLLRRTEKPVNMLSAMKLYKQQCREPIDAELVGMISSWLEAHFPRRAGA
jgi:pimeloyl-ACP methyl ester carboxylesterase